MSITAQELRRNYASMSDDELQSVDPDALTEVACRCFEAEMKRRGLSRTDTVKTDDDDPAGGDLFIASSFVNVPGGTSVQDAEDAYRALTAAGISTSSVSNPPGSRVSR